MRTASQPDESTGSAAATQRGAELCRAASAALEAAFVLRSELSPREVARVVTRALPAALGRGLWRFLADRGWLDARARVECDLDEATCSAARLAGIDPALLRLAVFGLPGQGVRSDARRRESIYQQRCSEIMREVRDPESLAYVSARALNHPEVRNDPILEGMLRAFIAEREAELRARAHLPDQEQPRATYRTRPVKYEVPLGERVRRSMSKLRFELDQQLAAYNEVGANEVLERIRDLRRRYPGQVKAEQVQHCEARVAEMVENRDRSRRQLAELVRHAAAAAEQGDLKTCVWVRRRLEAMHDSLPALLPKEQLEEYQRVLHTSSERFERREAARRLVERERAVGEEVKRLRAVIHKYAAALKNGAAGVDPRLKAAFDEAAKQIERYDDDWFADLMIELDGMLEDLRGYQEVRQRAEQQTDAFLRNLRAALARARRDIAAIRKHGG